jgi:hypothetical protein
MHPLLPCDLEDTGRAILARAVDEARAVQPTIAVSSSLIDGPRVHALVEVARSARLIALGHERHPTLDRLLTGATVTGVAAASECPVVAVAPDWIAAHEHRCVLVGVKSTTESSQLLRHAFEMAAERKARLVILHAWELPGEYDDLITSRVDAIEWEDRSRHAIARVTASFQAAHPRGGGRGPRDSRAGRAKTPASLRAGRCPTPRTSRHGLPIRAPGWNCEDPAAPQQLPRRSSPAGQRAGTAHGPGAGARRVAGEMTSFGPFCASGSPTNR